MTSCPLLDDDKINKDHRYAHTTQIHPIKHTK